MGIDQRSGARLRLHHDAADRDSRSDCVSRHGGGAFRMASIRTPRCYASDDPGDSSSKANRFDGKAVPPFKLRSDAVRSSVPR